ncbi:MAG: hypothetical protein LBV16_06890 [Elusimicrobiota bacterium]|jgi:mRNA-degrading endonuclease RelE of RelBE toxin-antitoxin system|nr:hypothetical protein [Elusimicrobiota bacterium]
MAYRVKFSAIGRKAFAKLDNAIKREISLKNHESFGKLLRYEFFDLCCYHIGSFRVIANIQKVLANATKFTIKTK